MVTNVRNSFVMALVVLGTLVGDGLAQTPLDRFGLSQGRQEQAWIRPHRVKRTRQGWAAYGSGHLANGPEKKATLARRSSAKRDDPPATITVKASLAAHEKATNVKTAKLNAANLSAVDLGTVESSVSARWDDEAYALSWSSWPRRPSGLGGLWFRGGYLLWWTDGMDTPALVTQSPDGTAQNVAGVLGQATTTVLVGDESLNRDSRGGALYTLGIPLSDCGWSLEGTYLFLGDASDRASFTSTGNPVLARPFFDVSTGADSASLVAFTGLRNGTISVSARSEFETAEVLLRRTLLGQCDCGVQVDLIAGYRYGGLTDRLSVNQSTNDTGGAAPGSSSVLADHFTTDNNFHGAQIGTVLTYRQNRWSLELLAKLALGNTHSTATVRGTNAVTDAMSNTVTTNVGLLAQATNIGRFESDQFAVMPELGVTLSYEVTCNLDATVGYRFLYISRVARAGDQIDVDLNLSDPLVGAARPAFAFEQTDFWAQGLVFGLDYRF